MFDIEGFGDPTGLSAADLTDRFRELEHHRRLVDAALIAVVGEAQRTGAFASDGHASVSPWCRASGNWSPGEARRAKQVAALAGADETFRTAVRLGHVGIAHAGRLAEAFANPRCGHELLEDLDAFVALADRMPYTDLRDRVTDWVSLHDVDGTHRGREYTHDHRSASINLWDGAVTGAFTGGAADGARMHEIYERFRDAEFAIDWEATVAEHGDAACTARMPRTDAQRRFDALVAIFDTAAAASDTRARASVPSVQLVVDVHTLDVLLNGTATLPTTRDVWSPACATAAGTPIAGAEVLSALWWGRLRTVIVDEHRNVVAMGSHRRLFTGRLADAVRLHATHCVWPGCDIPSRGCQADHLHEHALGGATEPGNGAPLCARHNRFKSRHRFTVHRDHDGTWHTRRPDGTTVGGTDPPGSDAPDSLAS